MSKKKVRFMCTAFRDGFQSVYGARVFTADFLPAVEATRDSGILWFDAGGGARLLGRDTGSVWRKAPGGCDRRDADAI